ncbi:MAG TPA: VOC family protein [Acidimicrobiia bacterium]
MSERNGYPAGTPSWVDVTSPDLDESTRFYGGLFGWSAEVAGDPALTGGYTMFTLRGRKVAGLGPLPEEGAAPSWSTDVTVDDADRTIALAREHGAVVVSEATDVLDAGRTATFVDPTGARLSVWQPRRHLGAELVNEPNTLCWNELATRDINTAKDFYRAVFGWFGDTNAFEGTTYTEWKLGEHSVGGMIQIDEDWPDEIPSHWMVYFQVDDCDAAAERVEELGGKASVPPTDIPPGRFAVITDPHEAVFSIIAPRED